jgi:hypothetical protein
LSYQNFGKNFMDSSPFSCWSLSIALLLY